jgi:pilus assembly protein CpaC
MISALLALALSAAPEPVRVAPGTQEVIKVPGVTKLAVGDPEVADVVPTSKGELLVSGKKRGRTSLTLWTASGTQTRAIVVDDGKAGDVAKMIREMVGPGFKVDTYNGVTVVDGVVDSVDELHRIQALLGNDPTVKLMVRINPRVLPMVAEQITTALHKAGIKDARATCVGSKIFLEGTVADSEEFKKAMLIADAYYSAAATGLSVR